MPTSTNLSTTAFMIAAGVVTATAHAKPQSRAGQETILSAVVKPDGVVFHVRSGGCTSKASFGLEAVDRDPLTIRLVRIRPDYCDARVPEGTTVKFTFAEIGAGPLLTDAAQKNLVILNDRPHLQ